MVFLAKTKNFYIKANFYFNLRYFLSEIYHNPILQNDEVYKAKNFLWWKILTSINLETTSADQVNSLILGRENKHINNSNLPI